MRRAAHSLSARTPRIVQIRRVDNAQPFPARPKQETPAKSDDKPFAKTSPDTPQARPEQADYIGARHSRAASDSTARDRRSRDHAPAAEGRDRDETSEIITFDEERQDGELEHEGLKESALSPPIPQQEQDLADAKVPPPAEGSPDGYAAATTDESEMPAHSLPTAVLTLQPVTEGIVGDLLLQTEEAMKDTYDLRRAEQARLGVQQSRENNPPATPATRRRAVYDPALSAKAQQPGFRTYERKTRSNGIFVFGKGAALNVESTPRGQYEAEIYRRVARNWYAACDEHRGDIVPGHITLSLRLNRKGQLVNMQLIRRRGAGVSQQSFTYAAIRRAALPPMPAAVQNDIVGELLELIFTFHFD